MFILIRIIPKQSVWIQKRQRDNRHDLHSKTASGEIPGTECRSIQCHNAFDTVSRDGVWKTMAKFGCQPRSIAMVWQFHDVVQSRVQNDGEFSETFKITNGVKQGCGMAPTQSGTVLMTLHSSLESCKVKLRCRLMCKMISSMQMIWIRMLAQRQKCKEPWIKSHSNLITMISQSAQNRDCSPTSTWKKPIRLWYCQPSCMHARPGQYSCIPTSFKET